MRIYDFGKQHGLSNKEVFALLREAGIEAAAPSTVLSPDEIEYLESAIRALRRKRLAGRSLLLEPTTLGDLADSVKVPSSEVILFFLKKGVLANKNQLLSPEQVAQVAEYLEIDTKEPQRDEKQLSRDSGDAKGLEPRLPVVVVMGHVDHGKTTLLDYVRKTRVASREKGGITQHLGAYEVPTDHGNIIFLDTPGHEAFTIMRMRGVKVADIAILMVAADDGVMPQTKEAISQAQAMDVPMIVAINKVDKVDAAQIELVKTGLSQIGIVPEDWGGDVPCVPISAQEGTGVDQLLELIALQAEVMELKGRSSGPGAGYILESKIERGRGSVATLILQSGIAKFGDYFTSGATGGRVNSIVNTHGKTLKEVGPSVPVQIGGFDALPEAGVSFTVVTQAEYKKNKSARTIFRSAADIAQAAPSLTTTDEQYTVILKADVNSSKEALVQAMAGINKKLDANIVVVLAGVGAVTESDVDRATATGAQIYAFGVKADANAASLARQLNVPIHSYYVIYHLLDAIKEEIERRKKPIIHEVKSGVAEVRKVFKIKGAGVIAGCYVKDGKIVKPGKIVAYRNGTKIGEGAIRTLQKDKKTVKSIAAGHECAFIVDGINDWREGDIAECHVDEVQTK